MIAAGSLLTVTEAAERRRSIREFEPRPIPREHLEQILDVVRRTPSAFNVQPWRFVVVESPQVKAELAKAAFNQRQFNTAPAVLVLYTDMADALAKVDEMLHPGMDDTQKDRVRGTILARFSKMTEEERETWAAAQGNIALGYLLLAIESHGYQSSPMAGFDPDKVKTLPDLPANVRIPAIVAVGIGTEEGFEHHRHSLHRISSFV